MKFLNIGLGFVCIATSLGAAETPRAPEALAWTPLPALPDPIGVAGPFVGVAADALIVAGGANFPAGPPWDGHPKQWHDRIFVLGDPEGPWHESTQKLPRPLAYGVSLTHEDGVICLGGGDADRHSADVFILRRVEGKIQIQTLPPMPGPAAFFCGAILGGTIYVAGGLDRPDAPRPMKNFWALDLSTPIEQRQWEHLEPWPGRARMLATAGAQDGSFFIFSGVDLVAGVGGKPTREYLRDGYRFTPGEGWLRIADLPRPSAAAPSPAIALGQSHLLIAGGDDGAHVDQDLRERHPGFSNEILAYHTITDTWSRMGKMPKDPAREVWPPVTTATTLWRGRVIIPSGETRPGIRTPMILAGEPVARLSGFRALDIFVIVLYMASLAGMGFYFARREKSTEDFFLAGRRIPWWAAGISIFGTQLSAITFMAVPALVYRTDWVYFLGGVTILAVAPLVVWVYMPFYRRLNVTTAYEYLENRFNVAVRLIGSAAFILFQIGRMGVVLYLPALALTAVTGFNVYLCIAMMGVLATLYTVLGGIEAVIWTDVLQVIVLMGGALLCLGIIVGGVEGGIGAIVSMGSSADKMRMVQPDWSAATTALWVVILGRGFENLFPYTADQAVVQRYLTTADEKQAARAIWTNAVMTLPAVTTFFALGTALWAYYRTHPHLINPFGRTDDILPWFVAQQLPAGLAGLVIAGLLAASMSSLDSSMNSMATAMTTDFYRRFVPSADDRRCLKLAKVLTFLLGALGTGAALYMAKINDKSMWDQYTKIIGLFGGGLAGLFAVGIFTRRANGMGAIVGFLVSAAVLHRVQSSPAIHFFLYSGIGFVTCFVVAYAVSIVFPSRRRSLIGLTIHTLHGAEPKQ